MTLEIMDIGVIVVIMGLITMPLWVLFGRLNKKFSKLSGRVELIYKELAKKRNI